jgi:uncharacterized protein YbbC (DUF1343 family)
MATKKRKRRKKRIRFSQFLPARRNEATSHSGDLAGMIQTFPLKTALALAVAIFSVLGCSSSVTPSAPSTTTVKVPSARAAQTVTLLPPPTVETAPPGTVPIMLGIDVLEARGFDAIKGKRIGLLTHPAGVNRHGVSTIDVLRRAPGVKLVALYGPEHGIYGDAPATFKVANTVDKRTGLPVFSVYGQFRKPTKAMLKGLDAMVIDLQDIGTRSYTFVSAMRYTMEACFENGVEVIVLDRPNPLGGLKVDGPPLDPQWVSYVGAFRVPYVHGLTIGELARMAKEAPGVLTIPESVRAAGKLTVIPMRGWRRSMRWPETGLTWVPTSPLMPDFSAVQGYAMVGLGTYWDPAAKFDIGFRHGVGKSYPFRGISHSTLKIDLVEKELQALKIPGLQFRRVSAPDEKGLPAIGLFVEISDWDDWRPTELSFYLMRLACKLEGKNPFLTGDSSGFIRHMGSTAFLEAIKREGAHIDIDSWIHDWQARSKIYQQQSKKYWLYL